MKLVIRYHEDIFGSFANDIDSNEHVSSDDAHIFFPYFQKADRADEKVWDYFLRMWRLSVIIIKVEVI